MNSINVKMEKANNAILTITTLFRFIEMFVFLIVISRFSSQLPFTMISADQFRGISFAVFSPRFVFVVGNVIVLILFFKSRAVENDAKIDVYDECVRRCEKNVVNNSNNNTSNSNNSSSSSSSRISISTTTTSDVANVIPSSEKKICRSRSENLMIVECKSDRTDQRKLRRSVTEKKMMAKKVVVDCGGGGGETEAAEDELSSEEFRRTVEEFIMRQQRSLRDEEFVVSGGNGRNTLVNKATKNDF